MESKKAQGLPITTIVLIVIAVVGLVVIAIFFFGGFSGGKESTSTFLDISFNRTASARCKSVAFGGCPNYPDGDDPSTPDVNEADLHAPYCCSVTGECIDNCGTCTGATSQCSDNVCRATCS